MSQCEQLFLFGQSPTLSLTEYSMGASTPTTTIILPKKHRTFTIDASIDEITAKKLLSSWQRQLKRLDKNAQIYMQTNDRKSPWHELPFLCIDTETTGLDRNTNRVIEVAWVLFHNKQLIEQQAHLCGINEPLPPEITRLTGISDEMLEGKPAFSACVEQLFETLNRVAYVVAYNAPFDKQFIEAELKRIGKKLPDIPWIDPCTFIREVDKYQKGKKLSDAAARWGVELNGAHRALADAMATGHLLYKLVPSLKIHGLEELLRQQGMWREQQEKSFQAYVARKKVEQTNALF